MSTDAHLKIEQCIKENHLKLDYDEFNIIEEIGSGLIGKVYKANREKSRKYIALKSFSLETNIVEEIVREIKLHKEVDFNNMIMELHGITKDNSDNYFLVVEYAEGGTLHNYLKKNFSSLSWEDKYGLALQLTGAIKCLHDNGIVHKDLHSKSILVQRNSIKLADFGLSNRIKDGALNSFDIIPYIDPQVINIEERLLEISGREKQYELDKKSDVYSVGVLFWELSSGKKPFAEKYDSSLAKKIAQGLRENIVRGTPKEYSNIYEECWDDDPDKRPTIQKVFTALTSMVEQQIIQKFKLNYGLFLDGYKIKPSKQAVYNEGGKLSLSLYEGQPLVYTFINDRNKIELDETLQSSDICINFPIAEITYTASLSESFSKFTDDDAKLHENYGHQFARKVLVGGKLFIDDLKLQKLQIDSYKSLLNWAYISTRYNGEIPSNNLSVPKFVPEIKTQDGKLDTPEKLIIWMNNLYQKNTAGIISYNDLIPISELRSNISSSSNKKQQILHGIADFKDELSLEDWVKDSIYVNLTRLIKDFHLLQGLIINPYFELENSEKVSVDFINISDIELSDKFYLEMIRLEDVASNNNLLINEISPFPFIKKTGIKSSDLSRKGYMHFQVKYEKYRISLNKNDIKPSEEFKQDIERALESMMPFKYLQGVFDKYGHYFPLDIVLGKSLKNIFSIEKLQSEFSARKIIDLKTPISPEDLKLRLDEFGIPYLLTQKGNVVEEKNLPEWIQNIDNGLEIIEFGELAFLYEILGTEQKRKIDIILNTQKVDSFKIIMTGIINLKDSDINNIKRINIEPSLEGRNYEVFGSVISEDGNTKLENFLVTFGMYDFDGFSVMINKLSETNINIKGCHIFWMIIGNPSKLSVFSPKNRELQVLNCIKKSITLQQPNNSYYLIETSYKLSEGHIIFLNAHSTNFEFNNAIKLVSCTRNSIRIELIKSSIVNADNNDDQFDNSLKSIEIIICILSSNYKNLQIDNKEEGKYSLNKIGYNITKTNFLEGMINYLNYLAISHGIYHTTKFFIKKNILQFRMV